MDDLQSMAIEVKGGKNVGIATLRALRGVLENDAALIVGLLILEPLGVTKERNFHRFAALSAHATTDGCRHPERQRIRRAGQGCTRHRAGCPIKPVNTYCDCVRKLRKAGGEPFDVLGLGEEREHLVARARHELLTFQPVHRVPHPHQADIKRRRVEPAAPPCRTTRCCAPCPGESCSRHDSTGTCVRRRADYARSVTSQ